MQSLLPVHSLDVGTQTTSSAVYVRDIGTETTSVITAWRSNPRAAGDVGEHSLEDVAENLIKNLADEREAIFGVLFAPGGALQHLTEALVIARRV